jgi:F0F1-type ATP synthase assembly protein I
MTQLHDSARTGCDTVPRKTSFTGCARTMSDKTPHPPVVHATSEVPKWSGLTTAQSLAVASQFGVSLAVGVGVGLVAGQWLDAHLQTGFVFTLLGVLIGLVAGTGSVVALYRATLRTSESEWRGRR